jgi:hypothetical protein
MNPSDNSQRTLPRYGIRDDEKTRPCVILYDWNGDDEAAVQVAPILPRAEQPTIPYLDDVDFDIDVEDDDDTDVNQFRPRWHGVGRQPGAVALAVVLGLSLAIGIFAVFEPAQAQAGTADQATLSLR